MNLIGMNGNELSMKIIDYQFPNIMDEIYDANWLNIKFDAVREGKTYSIIEPALLTWEMIELIHWLKSIYNKEDVLKGIDFIEPTISFELKSYGEKYIRIMVILECKHKSLWDEDRRGYTSLIINCNYNDFNTCIEELTMQASKYPKREPQTKCIIE